MARSGVFGGGGHGAIALPLLWSDREFLDNYSLFL